MDLPEGVSEQEFIDIVDAIAVRLAHKFKFGYYTIEDIRQECFIEAIDGLTRYDNRRPLSNFLWIHIKNRLCNLKRKKYIRREKPCDNCPLKAYLPDIDGCSAYDNKLDCDLYNSWFSNNSNKQNIMNPVDISCINDESENNMRSSSDILTNIASKEIIDLIDKNISISMRKHWLQRKAGENISKKYTIMLMEEITLILEENNIDVSKAW